MKGRISEIHDAKRAGDEGKASSVVLLVLWRRRGDGAGFRDFIVALMA